MTSVQQQAKVVFDQALEIESEDQRHGFLAEQFDTNPEIRSEVEGLLQAYEKAGGFLESDHVEPSETEFMSSGEGPGTTIGPYKLLQAIGEGGMGTVYLAERLHPVKQRVALKIIKHGMDSKKFVARFEAERQALAMMDHPNIAKVLDAGCTEAGRPYFVMELVKGTPISEFCDENRLSTRQRLELFVPVCHAVQHAHQKGVIHRDIKPSNVLVALYDQTPVPKVIDFGVAKATNQQLTEKTLFTEVGSILGTWEYMSPEQAVMNQLDVDTRTDVYSLGVLLYELLTGETPLDRGRLRDAQLMETLRMIREEEPPKPSTRVSSLGERASVTAAYRNTQPESLATEIKGDLDWIVMKALAKERNRRYDSPNRLAEEIERYLHDETIEARPPSTWYQLRKFYERNKVLSRSVAVVFVALTLALGTVYHMNRQLREALREWRAELIDRGLEAAFRGDLVAVQTIVEKADRAGAPEDWCLLLEGLAHGFGNNSSKANELLHQARRINSDNLAITATLLSMGTTDGDRFDQAFAELGALRLEDAVASGEFQVYEALLLGWGQLFYDPKRAKREIESAIKARGARAWPIAQVLLAHAEAHVALDLGDLAMAEGAAVRAAEASVDLDSNPFAEALTVWTQMFAWQLALEFDPESVTTDRDAVRASVERLADSTVFAPGIRAFYHMLASDQQLVSVWGQRFRGDMVQSIALSALYSDDSSFDPHTFDVENREIAGLASCAILAAQGNADEAMEGYHRFAQPRPGMGYVNAFAMQIPLLVGRRQEAVRDAQRVLDSNRVPDFPFNLAKTRLEYYAQRTSETQFLERTQGSRHGQCIARYAIALHSLHENPAKAREELRQAVATNQFLLPEYYMAKALLKHHRAFRQSGPTEDDSATTSPELEQQ